MLTLVKLPLTVVAMVYLHAPLIANKLARRKALVRLRM
jgi:hypothetical protein